MRTERVTVLMRPEEKARMERHASAMGVSSGELVRMALDDWETPEERAELQTLASELHEAMPDILAKFDSMHQSIVRARAAIRECLEGSEARRVAGPPVLPLA